MTLAPGPSLPGKQRKSLTFSAAVGLLILSYMAFFNRPVDRIDNVYESQRFDHTPFQDIHFSEESERLGVNYRNPPGAMAPSVSVVDVNNDGYMDIYVTSGTNEPNLLFINHEGRFFTEEGARYGLADVNRDSSSSFALWGDFNNDGFLDLVLAKWGCHRLFLGDASGGFHEHSELLNGYCSKPDGVNAADFYGHGRLDLIFANYLPPPGDNSYDSSLWMQSTRYDDKTGGWKDLLKNDGNGFHVDHRANFLTRSYTHSAGISDIDLDGRPDVFFANDYGFDQMFLNRGGGRFKDVTDDYIPKIFHGMSGMNAEFFDVANSGRLDLYVSNIYKPPFSRSFNLLWQKQPTGKFKNISTENGTARCGFSWAGKFADFNNDGEADLFVVNGRDRDPQVVRPNQGKSLWYERIEISQIPKILRSLYKAPGLDGRYISAFEHKCLFMQRNGKFFDVARSAGIEDVEESRGLSLIDYDNDGRMDLITSGPLAKLKIYHNETRIQAGHHWIGFQLRDKAGSVIPHGARAVLARGDGSRILREFYPANGYRGFSDPRLHFGLGDHADIKYLEVSWPLSKVTRRYSHIEIDKYNLIEEGAGYD